MPHTSRRTGRLLLLLFFFALALLLDFAEAEERPLAEEDDRADVLLPPVLRLVPELLLLPEVLLPLPEDFLAPEADDDLFGDDVAMVLPLN